MSFYKQGPEVSLYAGIGIRIGHGLGRIALAWRALRPHRRGNDWGPR